MVRCYQSNHVFRPDLQCYLLAYNGLDNIPECIVNIQFEFKKVEFVKYKLLRPRNSQAVPAS